MQMLTLPDTLRFQVHLLPRALLLRLAVDPHHRILRCLRRRCLHRREPPSFQQMVESGQAQGPLRGR